MDNEKDIKQPQAKKEKRGRDLYKSIAVFVVLPVILTILIPLGGLAYLCGRWNWPLGLVACMLYPAIALFIISCFVAGIDRLAGGWRGQSQKRRLLIAAEIGLPVVFVVLLTVTFMANIKLGLCFPGKVFVHGFRDRIQNKVDTPAIRDWLRTLDKGAYDGHDDRLHRDRWPESLKALKPGSVHLEADQNGDPVGVRIVWGAGFFHWGMTIAMEDIEIPVSKLDDWYETWLLVEPGVYVGDF
jgi:uncharacterized integral membrane protein